MPAALNKPMMDERLELCQRCRNVARHVSRRVTPKLSDKCPTISQWALREHPSEHLLATSGRFWATLAESDHVFCPMVAAGICWPHWPNLEMLDQIWHLATRSPISADVGQDLAKNHRIAEFDFADVGPTLPKKRSEHRAKSWQLRCTLALPRPTFGGDFRTSVARVQAELDELRTTGPEFDQFGATPTDGPDLAPIWPGQLG